MICAFEKLEVHVVVIRDGSTGPAIFALYVGLLFILVVVVSKSPDTTAKAFSDTAVLDGRLRHGRKWILLFWKLIRWL